MALMANTGDKQRETQTAWKNHATANFGGEVLILSKRESGPCERMRAKRWDPTFGMLVFCFCAISETEIERRAEKRGSGRTSNSPNPHRGTQCQLSPIPPQRAVFCSS